MLDRRATLALAALWLLSSASAADPKTLLQIETRHESVYEKVAPAVVAVECDGAAAGSTFYGTGMVISSGGLVLTCSTVVPHASYAEGSLDDADLVIVGPGPGDPRDVDDPKIGTFRRAVDGLLASGRPFLAVCLGHQVLCDRLGIPLAYKDIVFQGTQDEVVLEGEVDGAFVDLRCGVGVAVADDAVRVVGVGGGFAERAGALVGGASLIAESFAEIVNYRK